MSMAPHLQYRSFTRSTDVNRRLAPGTTRRIVAFARPYRRIWAMTALRELRHSKLCEGCADGLDADVTGVSVVWTEEPSRIRCAVRTAEDVKVIDA